MSLICFIVSAILLLAVGLHVIDEPTSWNALEVGAGLIALGLFFSLWAPLDFGSWFRRRQP